MSNWSEEQEKRRELRENKKAYREKMGGYFLDLSKLSFAGMVIGGIMSVKLDDVSFSAILIIVMGILFTIMLARIGKGVLK